MANPKTPPATNSIEADLSLEVSKPLVIVDMICGDMSEKDVADKYGVSKAAIRRIAKLPDFRKKLKETFQVIAPLMVQDTMTLFQKLRDDNWQGLSPDQQAKFALGLVKSIGDMLKIEEHQTDKAKPTINIENVQTAQILLQRHCGEASGIDISAGTVVLPDDDVAALLEQIPEDDE